MKTKIHCIFLVSAIFLSCTESKIDQAKELISKDLNHSLNDFKSYEPVEFGSLDSAFSEYGEVLISDIDTASQEIQIEEKKLEDAKRANFKPVFIGFKMSHSFRSKNPLGATILSNCIYFFDKDIKKVENRKDL